MILEPLDQYDPRLRQACAPLTKAGLRELQQQIEIEAMLDYVYGITNKAKPGIRPDRTRPNTVGLSANQVGIMKRITIVDLAIGRKGYTDIHVLVNPEITWRSKSMVEKLEGCVNFPTTWGQARRCRSIRLTAWDRSGNELELKLEGWPAVLMQHEVDHLDGYLFIDHLVDPTKAHRVDLEDYERYRKIKPGQWDKFVDVADQLHRK